MGLRPPCSVQTASKFGGVQPPQCPRAFTKALTGAPAAVPHTLEAALRWRGGQASIGLFRTVRAVPHPLRKSRALSCKVLRDQALSRLPPPCAGWASWGHRPT
jgi:hypothetical protein